jgi:hypothetical protein
MSKYGDIDGQGTIAPLPSDFNISGQAQGDVLYFNGSNWVRLAPGTDGQHLRTQGAAANPVWETVGDPTDLNISGQTTGDMLYYNGANWVRLAGGTSGDVLTANGAGVAPTYQTPAGGGGSNVIYNFTGWESLNGAGNKGWGMDDTAYGGTYNPLNAARNLFFKAYGHSNVTCFPTIDWVKTPAISTLTLQWRSWYSASNGYVHYFKCGATLQSANSATYTNTTPVTTDRPSLTLDVSSLSDGTEYPIQFYAHRVAPLAFHIYISKLVIFGS